MTAYTFQDEFDGPAGAPPDPSKWSYDLGGGGWGNNELEIYTDSPANAFQDGRSHLVIRAEKRVAPGGHDGRPQVRYHSARIKTLGLRPVRRHFEARIKLNSQRGFGFCCSG
jgi:hypothetical protein